HGVGNQPRFRLSKFRGGQVMIARSLVTQCPVDYDEVWRWTLRHDLAGRSNANQETAAGNEELFGEQHSEGSTDGAADDSKRGASRLELVEVGVIAGPGRGPPRATLPPQSAQDVSVGVE